MFYILLTRIIEKDLNINMDLYFSVDLLSPFLNTGTTWIILKTSANLAEFKEAIQMWVNTLLTGGKIFMIKKHGIWSIVSLQL